MFVTAEKKSAPVAFGAKMAHSHAFKALFSEGMMLVEEVASYLDGQGREDARRLLRVDAISYASESMRLTTRLMQLASWLLLQRAINEGEMSSEQAEAEKSKVRLTSIGPATPDDILETLPVALQGFIIKTQRMFERVTHLHEMMLAPNHEQMPQKNALLDQLAMLQNSFAAKK